MKFFTVGILVALSLALGACSSSNELEKCSKPREYQQAREVARIQVPDDLDPLEQDKLLVIPAERARVDAEDVQPCLAMPPDLDAGV